MISSKKHKNQLKNNAVQQKSTQLTSNLMLVQDKVLRQLTSFPLSQKHPVSVEKILVRFVSKIVSPM